ncbi:MAG: DUF370 domain-containing protein [Clostridia bacterium]|jgi:regulator of extracellular matrix RemA (YlzA/DUF370 family)|nr:DUF370 domain-containing protein [Clostridia bacterium]MEE1124559.1 DUF370 domain-containing protein [Acutalibacteraceae bacterium]
MKLINIGFGNFVSADKVIAVVSPDSAPIKRIIQDAKEQGMLIDATYGRKTRSVIIAESEHIILSAINPESLGNRAVIEEVDDNE